MAKKSKRYHVEFDIRIDAENVKLPQIRNWVRSHCGDKGRIRRDNPFYDKTLDPIYGTLKVAAVK